MGKLVWVSSVFCFGVALAAAAQPAIVQPVPTQPLPAQPLPAQPVPLPGMLFEGDHNPIFIPGGPHAYGRVFDNVLKVLIGHGFEIQYSNRYDGRIECLPRIAPGLGLFLRPCTCSFYERLLATLQTYRHRLSVIIQPADNGGYFVEVIARKELEDLARPTRATAGAAIFRNDNNVERVTEVIDATVYDSHWLFKGRDVLLERALIEKLQRCM